MDNSVSFDVGRLERCGLEQIKAKGRDVVMLNGPLVRNYDHPEIISSFSLYLHGTEAELRRFAELILSCLPETETPSNEGEKEEVTCSK